MSLPMEQAKRLGIRLPGDNGPTRFREIPTGSEDTRPKAKRKVTAMTETPIERQRRLDITDTILSQLKKEYAPIASVSMATMTEGVTFLNVHFHDGNSIRVIVGTNKGAE